MADFDMEQMRIIFQNLADKLANTKGDDNIVEKLKVVEKAIRDLEKRQRDQANKSKADQKRENQDFIRDFVKEFDNASVLKDIHQTIKEQGLNNAGPGQGNINVDSKDFGKLSSKIGGSILAFGKFTNAIGNTTASMINNFGNLDGSFEGLAKALGITSAAGLLAAKTIDDRNNAFRVLINSAEGTIGSIQDLGRAMHDSTLNAMQFADAIAKGTQGTRLMGAQPWAKLYGSILKQTQSMGYYGYSTQQLVAAQNEYLDMLSNRGDLFNRTDKQIVDGLNNLLVVNDKMATILGKTREEQLAAAAEQARDPVFQTWMQSLGDNVDKDLINQMMGALNTISPALKDIGQDMMMMNGGVTGEAAKVLAVLPPEVREILLQSVNQAKQGNLNAEQLQDAIQSLRAPMQTFIKENAASLGILGKQVGDQFRTIAEIGVNTSKIKQDDRITAEGTNITDQGSLGALQSNQTIREIGAAVRDTVTGVLNPLLNDYGPEIKNLVSGTSDLVNKYRETIIQLENFNTVISAIAGVFAGGAIINAASGIVGTLVAARMVPMIGEAVKVITSPLRGLAGSITGLGKMLTGGALSKSIGSSVANAVSKIPGLSMAARVAGPIGVGLAAGEAARFADEHVSNFVYENAPEEAKDFWYDFRKKGEGFWDFMAQNPFSGTIQSGPNAGKNYWTGEQEFKQDQNGEWVELTPEEKAASKSVDSTDIAEIKEAVAEPTEQVDPNVAAISDLVKQYENTLAASTPVEPVQNTLTQTLDIEGLTAALRTDSVAMQATVTATNAALDRIYQILKQNLDFDKESSQIIRDRLGELQRLNEDIARSSRR